MSLQPPQSSPGHTNYITPMPGFYPKAQSYDGLQDSPIEPKTTTFSTFQKFSDHTETNQIRFNDGVFETLKTTMEKVADKAAILLVIDETGTPQTIICLKQPAEKPPIPGLHLEVIYLSAICNDVLSKLIEKVQNCFWTGVFGSSIKTGTKYYTDEGKLVDNYWCIPSIIVITGCLRNRL